jgi:hypothetical protein
VNELVPLRSSALPELVAAAGERAGMRFLEFFAANIRNPHTRRAYARAADEFLTNPSPSSAESATNQSRGVWRVSAPIPRCHERLRCAGPLAPAWMRPRRADLRPLLTLAAGVAQWTT